jgi:predicted NAD/FAD-binding protein
VRIAVVGAGISGLATAFFLMPHHEVVLFERDDRLGGHANSVRASDGFDSINLDTGFLVFNDRTYPVLTVLFDRIGVHARVSDMTFSVRDEAGGLEYGGGSWNALFAQRRNLFRPSFHALLREILRFHREGRAYLAREAPEESLAGFLRAGGFSPNLERHYLVPMTAAIWSAAPASIAAFPARSLLRFYEHHGLLETGNYPTWFTVEGTSSAYTTALADRLGERIRLRAPVRAVRRTEDGVEIASDGAGRERFDQVVLALHSDQALAILEDPSDAEREILTALPYLENEAVLHTDVSLLPRRKRAWSSWNYIVPREPGDRPLVTYHLNRLHRLRARREFCVTLNPGERVAPGHVLRRISYAHPVASQRASAAQRRHAEISGVRRTHYAGAYWGYGFHEDGARSAVNVARALGVDT